MMVAWRLEVHRRFVTWMGTKLKQWLCCRLLLHFRSALQQPHENEWQLSSRANDSNKRENMIPVTEFWSMELTVTGKIDVLLYNRSLTSLSVLNAGRKTALFLDICDWHQHSTCTADGLWSLKHFVSWDSIMTASTWCHLFSLSQVSTKDAEQMKLFKHKWICLPLCITVIEVDGVLTLVVVLSNFHILNNVKSGDKSKQNNKCQWPHYLSVIINILYCC